MNEISIIFDKESPQPTNTVIGITVEQAEDGLQYKFMAGIDGKWALIKDFSASNTAEWMPEKDGTYNIIVQAKKANSKRPFDYSCRREFVVGISSENLLKRVLIGKECIQPGDRQTISVEADEGVLLRYWLKEGGQWELLKDYGGEKDIAYTVGSVGKKELLVEAKAPNSPNKFDKCAEVSYEVKTLKPLVISSFTCITEELYVDKELMFEVEVDYEDHRMVLYKFILFNEQGEGVVLQDYSSRKVLSFTEKKPGKYKLLCLARDMYSREEYDDRAILEYIIKPYREINIKSFTTDLSSPQLCGECITLKAVVEGGKNLLYRFIIDGNYGVDSGYIKECTYKWNTEAPGEYILTLWVKDESFENSYESSAAISFHVDELSKYPVHINQILLDKASKLTTGDTINVTVMASGGTDLRYCFMVRQGEEVVEKIEYGSCNWVRFTPEYKGSYELEIGVKHKYSKREYDAHEYVYLEVFDFIPAEIDYILTSTKPVYYLGEDIMLRVVCRNTKEVKLKYILKINGHKVEETEYENSSFYTISPRCAGLYTVEIYAKNKKSSEEYDMRKSMMFKVKEAPPITNTSLCCENEEFHINNNIFFQAQHLGGKDVVYAFYLMEQGEWNLVQSYSKNRSFSFIPYTTGEYRLLVLCKSSHRKAGYEDYAMTSFIVEP